MNSIKKIGMLTCMSQFKYKQVIVLRTDLGMTRGKIAAQTGHAAVSAAEEARKKRREWWSGWLDEGQCKIAVRVDSEEELLELERKARELRLPSAMIADRGLTELPPGTKTCLGIGPAPSNQVDEVTGSLSLL
jgi:PTH2 family peptidyl-tRNA hydrolase